jgi:hypothetical protein
MRRVQGWTVKHLSVGVAQAIQKQAAAQESLHAQQLEIAQQLHAQQLQVVFEVQQKQSEAERQRHKLEQAELVHALKARPLQGAVHQQLPFETEAIVLSLTDAKLTHQRHDTEAAERAQATQSEAVEALAKPAEEQVAQAASGVNDAEPELERHPLSAHQQNRWAALSIAQTAREILFHQLRWSVRLWRSFIFEQRFHESQAQEQQELQRQLANPSAMNRLRAQVASLQPTPSAQDAPQKIRRLPPSPPPPQQLFPAPRISCLPLLAPSSPAPALASPVVTEATASWSPASKSEINVPTATSVPLLHVQQEGAPKTGPLRRLLRPVQTATGTAMVIENRTGTVLVSEAEAVQSAPAPEVTVRSGAGGSANESAEVPNPANVDPLKLQDGSVLKTGLEGAQNGCGGDEDSATEEFSINRVAVQ